MAIKNKVYIISLLFYGNNAFGGVNMLNAFYNPGEAIEDAKSMGEWIVTIGVLVVSAVILAATPLIALKVLSWKIPLGVIGTVIVGVFLGALLLKMALSILGAKDPAYFGTVTALTYSMAPLSLGMLAASLLAMIPKVGVVLAALAAAVGGIAMAATQLRGIVELADTDIVTALVASLTVTMMGAMFSYMSFMWNMISTFLQLFMSVPAV